MSVSDIEEQLREVYNFRLSESAISRITARVSEDISEWQNRPLDPVYYIVWMDGIVFRVRHNGKVINKTVYLAVGLNKSGYKEVLGIWLGEAESAAFWMGVLTDLKARGAEDILITCTDNLNGFTPAIKGVFPLASTQICVVHQVRNSCKYVVWKDKKAFSADMKEIYRAANIESATLALENLDQNWGRKYPYAIKSWRSNWEELTVFFDFPLEIRTIIYTTNLIENLNGKISGGNSQTQLANILLKVSASLNFNLRLTLKSQVSVDKMIGKFTLFKFKAVFFDLLKIGLDLQHCCI